jgi:hypothetical protein
MKQETNNERRKIREDNLKTALELIQKQEFEQAGKKFAEAVNISSFLKYSLIHTIK